MARTNSRSAKMSSSIKFRAHETDVANLKLAAQRQGLDVSTFLRQILIRERILSPQ